MHAFLRTAILATVIPSAAAVARRSSPSPVENLRVTHEQLPVFPPALIPLGLDEGSVRVAFSVDTSGRVDDCVAVAGTHPAFARAAIEALRQWKFEPARINGVPVASSAELVFRFMVQGPVIVSITATDAKSVWYETLAQLRLGFRVRELGELDRVPRPLRTAPPAYSAAMANQGLKGTVRVRFYIDESGAVRMPAVDAEANQVLASLAIDALRQWRFEPPVCGGKPVLARASQEFRFGVSDPVPG